MSIEISPQIEGALSRIDELEQQISFQEQTIETLNESVSSQQTKIMELEKMIKLLAKELKVMQQGASGIKSPEEDSPPPHY